MSSLTIKPGGELSLPPELCQRYCLTPETPIRVIETRTGILLVPLTDQPMSDELTRELEAWQALGQAGWERFPFRDDSP